MNEQYAAEIQISFRVNCSLQFNERNLHATNYNLKLDSIYDKHTLYPIFYIFCVTFLTNHSSYLHFTNTI